MVDGNVDVRWKEDFSRLEEDEVRVGKIVVQGARQSLTFVVWLTASQLSDLCEGKPLLLTVPTSNQ